MEKYSATNGEYQSNPCYQQAIYALQISNVPLNYFLHLASRFDERKIDKMNFVKVRIKRDTQ